MNISQVEKAKRGEQSVATCVLELRVHAAEGTAAPSSQLLLVQRPESGLLAGAASALLSACPPSLCL